MTHLATLIDKRRAVAAGVAMHIRDDQCFFDQIGELHSSLLGGRRA